MSLVKRPECLLTSPGRLEGPPSSRSFREASHPSPVRFAAALAVGLALGAGVWTCARAGEKPPKVLVIGVDAGEWDVLGPLLDKGKVPNRPASRQGRVGTDPVARAADQEPDHLGQHRHRQSPEEARHLGLLREARAPRRARAGWRQQERSSGDVQPLEGAPVWDILGSLGKKVGVVGWWTTWPAQPVNGFLISDYVSTRTRRGRRGTRGARIPPSSRCS